MATRPKSKLIMPPFVVVNRTSSPRDRLRATATIIKGTEPVAVENHLIILSPKKGGLKVLPKTFENTQEFKDEFFPE